jgi:hypothetical protein
MVLWTDSRATIYSSTGNKYYILGGQHFCEALRMYREYALKKKIYPSEALLPLSLKQVEMEVYLETTPLHVRAWSAGRHQRKQEGVPASHSDFFAVAVEEAQLKLKLHKTVWMSDNDVFFCLERSGLRGDEENKMEERASKKMETTEASGEVADLDKELAARVCYLYTVSRAHIFSLSRKRGSRTCGATSCPSPARACRGWTTRRWWP